MAMPHQPGEAPTEGEEALVDWVKVMDRVVVEGGAEINIRHRDVILNWLSPYQFLSTTRRYFADAGEGGPVDGCLRILSLKNGNLVLEAPFGAVEFVSGAGKTVLASMVVDHLSAASKNNEDIGVACIYLNHKEADQQPPTKLLAGLWRQLVLDRDIGSIAESLYKQHREKGTEPSLDEVVNVLSLSLKEFSQVFIIVDAMDECPEFPREILLKQLAAMGSNVNLLITSRPNISPESSSFPNFETLDILAAPGDIQVYINAQIESSPHLSKHIRRKPELQEEILTKVIDTADGMFLLAKLYVQFLSTKNTIGHVREALKEPPKNLYDSYDLAMQQIEAQNEDNRKTAHSTLIWVANAKRPLTVSELTVALAIKPGAQSLNEDYLLDIETVLAVCAGLVIVDENLNMVRLVHYTTQEYLDSIQAQLFPHAQTEITYTLLTLLAFDGYPESAWASHLTELPPLIEYSQYCLAHAAGQPEIQLRDMLLRFLGQASQWKQTLAKSFMTSRWNSMPWNYPDWPSWPSALWVAAAANLVVTEKSLLEGGPLQQHSENPEIIVASYYGHMKIVSILLEKGADVNAAVGENGSSLQAAAAQGHTGIVRILLEKGANVNAAGGRDESSLQAAAAGGHTEIVSILLEKGADVNAAGGFYGSSLQAAAAGGHTEIVSILLEKGADVNAAGGFYGSSLQAAAAGGHTEIANIFLEKGADVNAAGGYYGSPLQVAAAEGHTEIFSILLEKGADVNAAGGFYGSSLQAAAVQGHTEIVNILLEKGADINAAEGEYGSSLQAAAVRGHTEIVSILLEKGADVNAAGGYYGSSLQAAAAQGHTEIVSILLEKGANINAAGGDYGSSLQAAAAQGHTEIVSILLEKGANINAAGGDYGSSLQAAAAQGHTEIVSILLEKGADINAAGGEYGSSLQAAAAQGHTEIVSILFEKGADVNAAGGDYGSSLQAAAARGHTEIVSILLEKGADVNAAGGLYESSLQAASAQGYTKIVSILLEKGANAAAIRGHIEIVGILLEKGADINAAGGRDGSSLQAAAVQGHTEIVSILLEKGADVNAAGGRDGSSLPAAAVQGHTEIVSILLEKGADINAAGGRGGPLYPYNRCWISPVCLQKYFGRKQHRHHHLPNSAKVL
ncbi:ANK-REP-REGION domain-containing protein [Mycena venus]|uniref:ANK-REP-REGION domain-containing protein n=1 Tax=Mycena venus TaxID=2733690 RepID=A0A8H6YZV0_9AGAR|nr:ANK-REP-REGION domain-containing protein [Mycena venus]